MKSEKVLEGVVMSEEELKKSRIERSFSDFISSPSGQDYLSYCIKKIFISSRR